MRVVRLAQYNPEVIFFDRWRVQYAPAFGWRGLLSDVLAAAANRTPSFGHRWPSGESSAGAAGGGAWAASSEPPASPDATPPAVHDIEQHAGYFCATHGFVLIDFCSCPDDDVVSLWTNERDDDRFVQVLNRHRESSAKGAGNGG